MPDRASGPIAGPPGPEVGVFVISVAAQLTGLHPQTLRAYERLGLVTPVRTGGGGRRYSLRDVDLLREIADLTAHGIGLEGVRRIMALENQVAALRMRTTELENELAAARDVLGGSTTSRFPTVDARPRSNLPVLRTPEPGQSVVVWRRGVAERPGGTR